jgi:hypothetical protein
LVYVGPASGNALLDVGLLGDFLAQAKAAGF